MHISLYLDLTFFKPSLHHPNVGCPSIHCGYVLLPLVKKEADIGQINDIGHAEQSQAGEPSKDTGKKKAETEGPQQTPEKQDMR